LATGHCIAGTEVNRIGFIVFATPIHQGCRFSWSATCGHIAKPAVIADAPQTPDAADVADLADSADLAAAAAVAFVAA
jgi:hypothetical protein